MSRHVTLRPAAQADVSDIWAYTVEAWSEAQAETYLTGLGQAFDQLAAFPEIARLRVEFAPPVRIFAYQQHLIIYTVEDTLIDVIRVVHSRADWTAFLSE